MRPRRAPKEPPRTRSDGDYFWDPTWIPPSPWMILVCLLLIVIVEWLKSRLLCLLLIVIEVALGLMCTYDIREFPELRIMGGSSFPRSFQDDICYAKNHVLMRPGWITDAWLTAIMDCPYILQRLLKHIKSHIFAKTRMNPAETIAAFGSSSTGRGRFILDSGASSHFVGNPIMLEDIKYFPEDARQFVSLADGSRLPIVAIGTLVFKGESECGSFARSLRVPNVRYVRGLAMNVISVGQLDKEHGLCSAFYSKQCEITEAGGAIIGQAALVNCLYEVFHLHVPRGPEV